MAENIKTKTGRGALQPRREPYWERIKSGLYVGYRKLESGDGTWVARRRMDDAKQKYHALGHFNDYDDALRAVSEWAASLDQGVKEFDKTVEDACREYVKHQKAEKGKASSDDADGRFARLVYGKPIGKIMLAKLQTTDVRKWLHAQVVEDEDDLDAGRRSKDSANRNLASLKAALNLALKDRLVATDAGWKTVTPFTGVGKRREHLLTLEERNTLLEHCQSDLEPLVKGLLLTAARPGELAKATVADFDRRHGTLVLDGKTGRRTVTLSSKARTFISGHVKGKLPTAPIFATEYGQFWNKDSWKKPFKEAVKSAKLPPSIVSYHLRHAAISEMLIAGMQTSVVAMLAGTSTAMIDKHYGHLMHYETRKALDNAVML